MFKKLKDKITEEVMQSPLKFQSSMPQLAQAVTSVISPNNSTVSEPQLDMEDNEEKHETPSYSASNSSDYDSSFTTVDLRSPSTLKTRRSSSTSTLNNELFPIYEFSSNRFTLQSDLESASEFDDSSSVHQFTNISKENLYEKYRDILQKYHKYRGRYSDTQKYCRDLQREYNKAKSVLTETQDKALRRIAELREQCLLEQKAKAHLEDALRNELEERDHVIDTLNTKIELLRSGKDSKYSKNGDVLTVIEMSKNDNTIESKSVGEIDSLKVKIKNFESILCKAKEAITRKNDQIDDLRKKVESTTNELKTSKEHIIDLQNNIDSMKRKEEEGLLSIAENKLIVHKELEAKETLIQSLENEITKQNAEIKKSKFEPDSKNETSQSNEEREVSGHVMLMMEENHIEANELEIRHLRNELVECRKSIDRLELSLSSERIEKESTLNKLKSEEEKILLLQSEISNLKIELSKTIISDDKLETFQDKLLENSKQLTKDAEIIEKLEKELQKANRSLDDWSKAKNLWNEKEMNLKADKIVLEETIKNLKNDLSIVRNELALANTKIEDFEMRLRTAEEVETRLKEYESRLSQSQIEVEFAKKTERELHDEVAKLLQEINNFESEREADRKANENLDAALKELMKLNESLNRENNTLKTEVEMMKETVSNENESLKCDLSLLSATKEELQKTLSKVEHLRNDNGNLRNDLENALNEKTIAISNLSEEEKKLQESVAELILENDGLKKQLEEALRYNECLRAECDLFKIESQKLSEMATKYRNQSECLLSQKEDLENELSKYQSKLETLSTEYTRTKEMIQNSKIVENQTKEMLDILREQTERLRTMVNLSRDENESPCNYYDYVKAFLNDIEPIMIDYRRLQEFQVQLIAEKDAYSNDLVEIKTKLDAVTDEKKTLSQKLSNLEVLSSRECNKYKNVIFELSGRILTIKNEYLRFRESIKDDIMLLRECCNACKTDFNERTRNTIQEHVKLYSDLANRFSDLENQNELLQEESIKLRREKEKMTKEVEELSEKLKEEVGQADKTKLYGEIQSLKEKYVEEVKELVAGYEIRLAEKDNEYEEFRNKMLLRAGRENIAMQEETKEIIKNLQDELTNKQDAYNELLEKYQREQQEMHRKLTEIKEQYARELRESEKNWRSCLDKKVTEVEDKYKEEISELTKEWTLDRKHDTANILLNENLIFEFLEDSANHCEDAEVLKKQVAILSNKLNSQKTRWKDIDLELSDNVKQSDVTLDDCTEMEYLRNILFKYMMGHQPVVLAKVLAAVVKFDSKQTKQIIQREEQKQSLLGQLGLNNRN